MFFSAEPQHRDLDFLAHYLASVSQSSCASSSASSMAKAGQRCASASAAAAPAPARCRLPQPMSTHNTQPKKRENQFEKAAPSSPPRAAPARPEMFEKNEKNLPKAQSPSIVFHHCPPSASSSGGAHLFSVDLPGRSLSSFNIDVEERQGTGRLYIHAAAIESGVGDEKGNLSSSFSLVPRKAMHLSLDLPRDADLSRVSADYDAGVLLIKVPLVRKEELPKRFKVVVGGGKGNGKGKVDGKGREEEVEVEKEEVGEVEKEEVGEVEKEEVVEAASLLSLSSSFGVPWRSRCGRPFFSRLFSRRDEER